MLGGPAAGRTHHHITHTFIASATELPVPYGTTALDHTPFDHSTLRLPVPFRAAPLRTK